jgi:hypothetical protein
MNVRKTLTLMGHAAVVWMLCGAAMGFGMAITSTENALIIHATAAPIIAAGVSWVYFTRFNSTTPVRTAITFVGFVILADTLIVSLLIEKSFEMFTSPIGTWIPFALIFTATYLTGTRIAAQQEQSALTSRA